MNIDSQTIDPNFLPSLPLKRRKDLPFISAIYLAIDSKGVIQYIGRSRNLNQRWTQHHRLSDLADLSEVKIAWLEVNDPDLLPEVENFLISRFDPPLNCTSVTKSTARNQASSRRESKQENYTIQTLIKWRLREVMARYKIKAVDLAREIEVSSNSISNLRNSDTMPRLDGHSLNNLCNALNKLALGLDEEITPMSLIDYSRDFEPGNELNPFGLHKSNRSASVTSSDNSDNPEQTNSMVIVLSQAKSA